MIIHSYNITQLDTDLNSFQALTLIDSKTGVSISLAGIEVDLLRQILNEGIVK